MKRQCHRYRTVGVSDFAEYITNPTKKRDDYPEMPPQNYLDEETRKAVATYMLEVKN